MIDQRHYDDDALLTLLSSESCNSEHLAACTECRERLEMFRMIANALRDEPVWDETPVSEAPVPETIANLRSFADRMAIEDEEAVLAIPDLLDGPRESWMQNLHRHPECRTAGVVRKLLEAVPAALDQMPRDAVELTALAVEIADHLEDATPQLRGAAWRERAYALFYTGDFAAAETAVSVAELHFGGAVVSEYDLARVGVVRALVERGLESYSSAIEHARESARRFENFGDEQRSARARLAEAHLLMSRHEYDKAYATLSALAEEPAEADDYGRVLGTLGFCCWKLGRVEESLRAYDKASAILEETGAHSDAMRSRWGAAQVVAGAGRLDDAIKRLQHVVPELERLGMMAAATQASLEMAEILVVQGDFAMAGEICQIAMDRFHRAQLSYTAPALTALALMHEAMINQTATPTLVSHVREYLRRIPDEPNLLFAHFPE